MRNLSLFLCISLVAALVPCAGHRAAADEGSPSTQPIGPILHQAEGLFRNMRGRDYPAIWALLSGKSREAIVEDVVKESGRFGEGAVDAGGIARDFAQGGPIARAYWDGYLREFDPETALTESRWEIGKVGEDSAEIRITHERAEQPAVLRMFREDGIWKVGLIETFRPRPLP